MTTPKSNDDTITSPTTKLRLDYIEKGLEEAKEERKEIKELVVGKFVSIRTFEDRVGRLEKILYGVLLVALVSLGEGILGLVIKS